MKLRKIKIKLLAWQGLVYRVLVIGVSALFLALGIEQIIVRFGVVGTALIWGVINMVLYYLYHYVFLRLFKFGEK